MRDCLGFREWHVLPDSLRDAEHSRVSTQKRPPHNTTTTSHDLISRDVSDRFLVFTDRWALGLSKRSIDLARTGPFGV